MEIQLRSLGRSHQAGEGPPATVADIDWDGKPEVVFGNFSGQIQIIDGDNGSLAKSIQVYIANLKTEPVLVDADADGKLDIIVANYNNTANT